MGCACASVRAVFLLILMVNRRSDTDLVNTQRAPCGGERATVCVTVTDVGVGVREAGCPSVMRMGRAGGLLLDATGPCVFVSMNRAPMKYVIATGGLPVFLHTSICVAMNRAPMEYVTRLGLRINPFGQLRGHLSQQVHKSTHTEYLYIYKHMLSPTLTLCNANADHVYKVTFVCFPFQNSLMYMSKANLPIAPLGRVSLFP